LIWVLWLTLLDTVKDGTIVVVSNEGSEAAVRGIAGVVTAVVKAVVDQIDALHHIGIGRLQMCETCPRQVMTS